MAAAPAVRRSELAEALRACRSAFIGVGLISCMINLLYLTGSMFMLQVYDRVLPSRKHPLAFPETWLKYRFQKAADRFVKQGRLEKRFLDSGTKDTEVAFLDDEGNYRTLISCGITGCAGEITEMISEVHNAGYRAIVIFAPGECLAPVQTGVDIALELYRLSDMLVIIADPGGSGEMSTDEIYSKLVTVSTFRS